MIKFQTHFIKGSASIADLFKENDRCGIYVLDFETGEKYVGQTIDIVKRYAQHRKTHNDIQTLSFYKTSQDNLDEIEKEKIREFESLGYKLRNIALMNKPYFEAPERTFDFDLLMTQQDQKSWLAGATMREEGAERRTPPNQRSKYETRLKKLETKKLFPSFIELLKTYFDIGIPYPESTEYSFFSISCLPQPSVYGRVNLHMLVLSISEKDQNLFMSIYLSKKAIKQKLSYLKQTYKNLNDGFPIYTRGGHDQINLRLPCNAETGIAFLKESSVSEAIRTFNLRLMRKGANIYGSSHCPQLLDYVLNSKVAS